MLALAAPCLGASPARGTPPLPRPLREGTTDRDLPRYAMTRVGAGGAAPAPAIDGALDDPAWRIAPTIGPLLQVVPAAGGQPSEETEIRLCYDADYVYVAILCLDSDPAGIRDSQMERDANLDPDDRVELLFDTFRDRRNAFWFQIGPAGSKGDALISSGGSSFNKQWNGIWYGRARITERGWQGELALPTKTLNFDPAGDTWGFNARRFVRRRNEEVRWASPEPRIRFFSAANAGALTGLAGLHQGLGLDVVPFAVVDHVRDRTDDDGTTRGDAGLDAFWRLSPNLKLSLSVNTDFAETEVDARQVNLTRFPLFFPEKRDFFLEDSGVYEFGRSGGFGRSDVIPFFSRRIGISSDGSEVPLLGAVKLTGQGEGYSFGLTDVQTDETHDQDGENLFAGRYVRHLGRQSNLGLVWTHGDPAGAGRADTYGADFRYRADDLFGEGGFELSSWVLRSDAEGGGDDDLAAGVRVGYPNDKIDASLSATLVETDFDPRLGFVPVRPGSRTYALGFQYAPRLNHWIRRLRFELDPELVTDTANRTETVRVPITPLGIEFDSGDRLELQVTPTREVLDRDFAITSGVTIPEDALRLHPLRARAPSLAEASRLGRALGGHRGLFSAATRDEGGRGRARLARQPARRAGPRVRVERRRSSRRRLHGQRGPAAHDAAPQPAGLVVELPAVGRPVRGARPPEPPLVDLRAGQRGLLGAQPGLGRRRRPPGARDGPGAEAGLHLPLLSPSRGPIAVRGRAPAFQGGERGAVRPKLARAAGR